MSTNNNGSALLLEWINQERRYVGHSSHVYEFSQLMSTDYLYQLLQRVNSRYFIDLNHLSFDFQSYFGALQQYLIEVEGKKIARGYRKEILDSQSIEQIIKIVFFLLLQTEQKTQYITRIVEMNVEVQSYLMQEIKKIQQTMENYVEIRDILTTVEKLEEENEALKERLKSATEANQQLTEVVLQTKQENRKIEKELNRYETEKKLILDQLQIVDLKEYIEIYRGIKQENSELSQCIQQIQQSKREAEYQSKAMKERISEDCQIINQLNQEIVELRSNYHHMKEQMSTLCLSYDNPHECLDDSVLRQNKNFGNVKVKLSLETNCSDRSLFLNNFSQDQENNQNQRLRHLNNQIMHKLQNCYKTITDLTHQVTTLKDDKVKLQKKNIFLEKKMGDLKKEQSRFMRELKKMGF